MTKEEENHYSNLYLKRVKMGWGANVKIVNDSNLNFLNRDGKIIEVQKDGSYVVEITATEDSDTVVLRAYNFSDIEPVIHKPNGVIQWLS